MAGIGIVTDSTAYMDDAYTKEHDIKVVPLKVMMGDDSWREGVDISNDEFYRMLRVSPSFPTTSQPSAGDFLEAYKEMSSRYDRLMSIHISSGISGTVESARTAASEMEDYPIEIIDSQFTGIALMMLIQEMVEARDKGMDVAQIKEQIDKLIKSTHLMFAVDTLEYLHKGGRIGGAQAMMGSMLKIKPILYLDGKIDALEKVRGSGKALDRLVELTKERLGKKKARVGFTHVQDEQRMQELISKVKGAVKCEGDVSWNETGPVVGSHTGPGTVGVTFFPLD
jgi:fatty acid kinase fatty acid binding subunit